MEEQIKPTRDRCDQKLKLLCVHQILKEDTDENHPINRVQITERLEQRYGIVAERKGIYKDISTIETFLDLERDGGSERLDIDETTNPRLYRLKDRLFSLSELKMLIDIVQSSQVVSAQESSKLVAKLKSLTSKYQRKSLISVLQPGSRIKTSAATKKILDQLNQAIIGNCKISCDYFMWDYQRRQILKNTSGKYILSPWELVYDDGKYYLVAYKEPIEEGKSPIRHFRIDKLKNIRILEGQARIGEEDYKKLGTDKYDTKMFGMFMGKDRKVHMLCDNWVANPLVDRFGKDVLMLKRNDKQFEAIVTVSTSTQFYAWIIGLGDAITITEPRECVDEMKKIAAWMTKRYGQ